jgi:Phytanoyl-CoA dioxygenase (PhyH)
MHNNERRSADPVRQLMADQGFAIVPGVLNKRECEELINLLGPANGAGRRGILGLSKIAQLSCSGRLLSLLQPHLPAKPQPVRGIYFDKSPEKNWMVAWHQDLTLAVRNQIDLPGFGPWSVKEGVPHVQAPVHLLEQMLTIRLHLDDCDEANGALQVIPGSHRLGRLSADAIDRLRNENSPTVCCVAAGDALLMRPLLLHSSGRSHNESHRRVIHVEYAVFALPRGLQWHETP